MNIIVLGPQGSGKGTQVELLANKFGLTHFDAGNVLRHTNDAKIQETINSGNLVPDEVMNQIVTDFVKANKDAGHIFDGHPRTVVEYDELKKVLQNINQKIDHVINIEITEAETIQRLSSRRTCSKCGEIYNHEGKCEKCGGELVQREDDMPEAIQKRLQIYREQTHPVFEKAVGEGIGFEVDGAQSIDKVFADILEKLHE